jgi:hypothetical protein
MGLGSGGKAYPLAHARTRTPTLSLAPTHDHYHAHTLSLRGTETKGDRDGRDAQETWGKYWGKTNGDTIHCY